MQALRGAKLLAQVGPHEAVLHERQQHPAASLPAEAGAGGDGWQAAGAACEQEAADVLQAGGAGIGTIPVPVHAAGKHCCALRARCNLHTNARQDGLTQTLTLQCLECEHGPASRPRGRTAGSSPKNS